MKNIGELFDLSRRGGSQRILPDDGVMMSVTTSARHGDKAIAIGIGQLVMKACRWVIGDRITIDMDCAKSELTLRRIMPSDKSVVSWSLATRSGNKNSPKGVSVAATIKFRSTPVMIQALGLEDITAPYVPEVVITGAHGVTFAMRKPWTVWNKVGGTR